MNEIAMSRGIADNILLNKQTIKLIPIIDSQKEKHIEVVGNELRTIKKYPVTYDFLVNVIDKIKDRVARCIKDVSSDYFELNILESVFIDYLIPCGNHTLRQSLARQLVTEMTSGFVVIKGKNYIGRQAPFRIMGTKLYQDGKKIFQIHLLKQVFASLVEGNCFKTGGEGYIRIPKQLYPITTQTDKGKLQSHNPVYKLNILGIMRNTHKKQKSIEVDRDEFLKTVVPEFYKDGYLTENMLSFHSSLQQAAKKVSETLPEHKLVENFYIGKKGQKSTIYFKK
jgi:hypothetical protein